MKPISLDDKYLLERGRIYVTGSQALVRLPLEQARRDAAAGLNTAGFISGYRGSPLGIYDMALWQAEKHLQAHRIHFEPGVNEDLAATAVWGSQQAALNADARHQGVFALWYGKGPGVDRSADVLKHGSYAGAHPLGGVLVLSGDDHAARSSTIAHQSDHALIHLGMPILHPATIQEYLDFGLLGLALSRYSGCWVGFKCVTDTVDGSASIEVDPGRALPVLPSDFELPPDGLGIRYEFAALRAEARLYELRHGAVRAFARANGLDRLTLGPARGRRRLGIVTTGKSWLDVMEALAGLGVDEARAAELGIGVFKVGMTYPLEPEAISTFARDCDEVLVIEEKRAVIEEQLARLLFNLPADQRPRLIGKHDETGRPFISEIGEFGPEAVTRYIAERYLHLGEEPRFRAALEGWSNSAGAPIEVADTVRTAAFCAGCPHNTSTRVPEGSRAMAGIGCHGMAAFLPDRGIQGAPYHMGGEGAAWIGQAPFVETPHVFQNLGDGTYFHSGILALRACVAARVNITYKILVNGAVGMTGGQPIEGEVFAGEITAPHVAQQVRAEGVERIAVVTDDPAKYGNGSAFPAGTTFHQRDDLDAVQRTLRECKGVSVLIYDQSCATERRRLRKRGKLPAAQQRLYIQPDVCEGCGDCGVQSNCIAIEPVETEFGRKRQINQSVCNQDYSCLKGFCPSFVTVTGGTLRKRLGGGGRAALARELPEVILPPIGQSYAMLVTGVGGNGVVTIGAILGMAAHLEGKGCTVLDMSGFAQRNGAVMSHVRLHDGAGQAAPSRIPARAADLVIGADPVVTASADAVAAMAPEQTRVVVNRYVAPTGSFAANPDMELAFAPIANVIGKRAGAANVTAIDATQIATALLGDAIGANMFLVGVAWQKGLIPLQRASIEAAIATNGTAREMNLSAFELGRLAVVDPGALAAMQAGKGSAKKGESPSLDAIVSSRSDHLTAYQNAALAARYRSLVERVRAAEQGIGKSGLAEVVAQVYAKLLSYKDEYEVARLYSAPAFREGLESAFEGPLRLSFNLAPPLLARRNKASGRLRKIEFGGWVLPLFRLLAALKGLRGTPFDLFGMGAHRRMERQLIADYEALIDRVLARLSAGNHAEAVALAQLYDRVRGYDVVKEAAVEKMRVAEAAGLAKFEAAQ